MKRFYLAFSIILLTSLLPSQAKADGWNHNADGTTGWKTLTTIGIGESILFIASCREAIKSGEVKNFSAFTKLCGRIFKKFAASCQKKNDRTAFLNSLKKYPTTSAFVLSLVGCGTYFAIEDILVSPRTYRASFKLGALAIVISTIMAHGNSLTKTYIEPNMISHYSEIFALQKSVTHLETESKKILPKLQSYLKNITDSIKNTQNKINTSLYKQLGQLDKALIGTQNTIKYLGENLEKTNSESIEKTVYERIESLENSYEEIATNILILQSIIENDETKSEESTELLTQLQASQMELKILKNQFGTTTKPSKANKRNRKRKRK